jgi:branched-chain amino acid transport system permease protein
MAFDLVDGYIGICLFGFAAFIGLGGYTSALLAVKLNVNPWIGMFAGGAVSGIAGFLLGVLTLRLRGIYAAVMSWFVALALLSTAAALVDFTRGYLGLIVPHLFRTIDMPPYYYVMVALTLAVWVILKAVTSSSWGLAFRAIGQNVEAAQASGVNPTKYKVLNLTLACALAGILGAFSAHWTGILTPDALSTNRSIEILVMSRLGGQGSLWGGVVVAFLTVPVLDMFRQLLSVRLLLYGLVLIAVTIAYPGGLAKLWSSIVKKLAKAS